MKKRFLVSIIIVSVVVIAGSLSYFFLAKGQTPTAATDSYLNTTQTVLIKKSGLTGVYSPPPSPFIQADLKGLAIGKPEVVRGAMNSPGDPPPMVKIPLTNTTTGTIEIRKNPKSGQYGFQVESRDEDGNPVDINAWVFMVELDLPPKVSTSISAELISSLETKGFAIYAFYKK